MTSAALAKKISDQRAIAHLEVQMARLCAEVIYAVIRRKADEQQIAVRALKAACGRNWSHVTAMQYMSGRRGEFAALAAPSDEVERLFVAHLVAKDVCGWDSVKSPEAFSELDLELLRLRFRAGECIGGGGDL